MFLFCMIKYKKTFNYKLFNNIIYKYFCVNYFKIIILVNENNFYININIFNRFLILKKKITSINLKVFYT